MKEAHMPTDEKPKTGKLNGRLWGARARDWAELQEPMTRRVYDAVFERIGMGTQINYLDVGCGSGLAAQLAAERGAKVSGVDAAENLLAIAQSRVPAGQFRVADLEELSFTDKIFDVVTGFNSFQYAANPDAALAQAKRVAKSGGAVVIVTWGKPEGMQAATLIGALKAIVPSPPPGTPGPFALSDEHSLRQFAAKAGLEPVEVVDVDSPFHYTDLSTALRGLMSSGNAIRAAELSSDDAVRKAYTDALEQFRQHDGSYWIGAAFRCLFTRA
ncbi:MAG: class I SAM-dependent methyltransferase [Deltaproteobacteria bacterium]|nr:MAG: class I SAM-dependent methyltransferase [Deltaproteobacteria bacterium]